MLAVLVVSFCLCSVASPSHRSPTDSHQAVLSPPKDPSDPALGHLRSTYVLPCLAAANNRNGSLSLAVTGARKYGAEAPAIPADQFHLGSLTKAMTATIVAQVIKEGFLTWDTTLDEALPELSDIMDVSHQYTTLRMLTSHRSGLSLDWTAHAKDLYFWWSLYYMSAYEGRWATVRRGLARPRAHDLETFTYDNTNFNIAGAIIERMMNSTWEDMLQERIFQPLEMTNYSLGPNDEESDNSVDNPWPHTIVKSPIYRPVPLSYVSRRYRDNLPALNAAGRVHCPIASYAKFLQAHLNGARGRDISLGLSAKDFEILHTPYRDSDEMPYTPGAWKRYDMLGSEGDYTLAHTGSNTYNMALAKLVTGGKRDKLYMAMTNVAGELADEGVQETVKQMVEGTLLS